MPFAHSYKIVRLLLACLLVALPAAACRPAVPPTVPADIAASLTPAVLPTLLASPVRPSATPALPLPTSPPQAVPPTAASQPTSTFDPAQSALLVGRTWVLAEYGDPADPTPVEEGVQTTAIFDADGGLSGSGGCNTYVSSYTMNGAQMKVGHIATTLMECEIGSVQEDAYLQALAQVESYHVSESDLELLYEGGRKLLHFRWEDAQAGPPTLEGRGWALVSLGALDNPLPLPPGERFTIRFERLPGAPSGVVSGQAVCHLYNAVYTAPIDDGIRFLLPAPDERACDPLLESRSKELLAALGAVDRYLFLGDGLQLFFGDKALNFVALPVEDLPFPELSEMAGPTWRLLQLGRRLLLPGSAIDARFEADSAGNLLSISGSAGCNTYQAALPAGERGIRDEAFIFGPAALTRKFCPEPQGLMAQEEAFVNALGVSKGYSFTGSQLILPTGYGALLFRNAAPGDLAETRSLLLGRPWQLQSIAGLPAPSGYQPVIVFDPLGGLHGSAGCNNFNASYTLDGEILAVTLPAATRMLCDPPVMEIEDAFLAALPQAQSFALDGSRLVIATSAGEMFFTNIP